MDQKLEKISQYLASKRKSPFLLTLTPIHDSCQRSQVALKEPPKRLVVLILSPEMRKIRLLGEYVEILIYCLSGQWMDPIKHSLRDLHWTPKS